MNNLRDKHSGKGSTRLALGFFLGAGISVAHGAELPDFVRDGVAGFVVSHIQYALSGEAKETGACPTGMNQSYQDPRDAYIKLPPIERKKDESFDDLESRVKQIVSTQPDIKTYCFYPEAGADQASFKTVTGENIPVDGIDLDGQVSKLDDDTSAAACPHQDFTASNGEQGIDNQFYRVVGCLPGYQPSGLGNNFNIGQLTGSWGLVIRLTGVDDLNNDDAVNVSVFANGDPIRLSPQREPLEYATYTVHAEPRFHGSSEGRIVDGVLRAGPMDVRFPYDVNAMFLDRVLRDAQLQLTISADGHAEGYLAGYAPVEEQYDMEVGYRDARTGTSESSELSPLRRRINSAIGKSGAMGYTCEGIYSALHQQADGHYDAEKEVCTSISTQYQIKAIPAFVIDQKSN